MFETIEAARRTLNRLRYSRAVCIRRLCQEDHVVLAFEGFGIQPWGMGWLIWRRIT